MSNIFAKKTIKTAKSLGKTLSCARKKKNISLEKAELDTKIRIKYLKALEEDDYKKIPPDVYSVGFLSRYAMYLGLDKKQCVKKYQQEKLLFAQLERKKFRINTSKINLISPGCSDKFQEKMKFVITPQIFVTAFVVFIVLGMLSYIWFQVKSFAAAPPLELNNPNEQIVVSNNTIEVTGTTDPTANLYINNQAVSIDEAGKFKQLVNLNKGINTIEIKAQNKANKETAKSIQALVVSEDEKNKQEGNNI